MAAHLAPLRPPPLPGAPPLKLLRALPELFACLHSGNGVGALLDPHSDFACRLESDLFVEGHHSGAQTLRLLEGHRLPVHTFSLPQSAEHAFPGLPSRQLSGLGDWLHSFGGALIILPLCDPIGGLDLWRNAQSIFELSRRVPLVFLGESRVQIALIAEALRLADIPTLPSLPLRAELDSPLPPLAYAVEVNPYPKQGQVEIAPLEEREAFECLVEHCAQTMNTHPDHHVGLQDSDGRILLTGTFSLNPRTGEVYETRPDPFGAMVNGQAGASILVRLGVAPAQSLPPVPPIEAALIQRLHWAHSICCLWEGE